MYLIRPGPPPGWWRELGERGWLRPQRMGQPRGPCPSPCAGREPGPASLRAPLLGLAARGRGTRSSGQRRAGRLCRGAEREHLHLGGHRTLSLEPDAAPRSHAATDSAEGTGMAAARKADSLPSEPPGKPRGRGVEMLNRTAAMGLPRQSSGYDSQLLLQRARVLSLVAG